MYVSIGIILRMQLYCESKPFLTWQTPMYYIWCPELYRHCNLLTHNIHTYINHLLYYCMAIRITATDTPIKPHYTDCHVTGSMHASSLSFYLTWSHFVFPTGWYHSQLSCGQNHYFIQLDSPMVETGTVRFG